ncbi:MAG: sulfite exporter TauE/SafE family protein [Clostridia bacterium]
MSEIVIGMFSGIFSGIGMGGGTILIFLLTTFIGLEQHIAQATNLIYFIPTAISAIIVNFKNKNIDTKLAIFVSIGGALGAIIGANISVNIGVQKLRRLFGIFLVIIVIHEIYTLFKEYKMSKKSNTKFS